MKASALMFAAAMSVSSLALAQTAMKSSVTETTDPAKIAEIERHAQQLSSGAQTTPMTGESDHMQKHGKRQHKNKAKQKSQMKDKAPSDTPMATESKR
jgi:hypothetical protein